MKRAIRWILGGVMIILVTALLPILWLDQSRKIYCVEGGCITVWKRIGGTCLVINGKYYWPFKPANKSYLQTFNWEGFSLCFHKTIPKKIIVIDNDYSRVESKHFVVNNNIKDDKEFLSYRDEYELLLFPSKELKGKSITANTDLITIYIKEEYAYVNGTLTR